MNLFCLTFPSSTKVSVVLEDGTDDATLECKKEYGFSVPITKGFASFEGLYINKEGSHYSLRYSTDLVLNGATEVVSNIFSVGVGPAAQIVLIKDASDGTVVGGKAFTPQPRAEVRDAGGNVLTIDSSSAVRVSFYSNPSRGSLSPVDGMIATLRECEGRRS